jgi:hypothetical protein
MATTRAAITLFTIPTMAGRLQHAPTTTATRTTLMDIRDFIPLGSSSISTGTGILTISGTGTSIVLGTEASIGLATEASSALGTGISIEPVQVFEDLITEDSEADLQVGSEEDRWADSVEAVLAEAACMVAVVSMVVAGGMEVAGASRSH